MKKLILTSLILVFAVVPAMAGDKSDTSMEPVAYQALSNMSGSGQMTFNMMTNEQLATIEGQQVVGGDFTVSLSNSATQSNEVTISGATVGGNMSVTLSNTADQSNTATIGPANGG